MIAERGGQLDPQSMAVQSVGVLIGCPSFIAGKLPWSLFDKHDAMSEFYEGAVVSGDAETVSAIFRALTSRRSLRLVRFDDRTYGIYPVDARSDPMDEVATNSIACQLSVACGHALGVLYDNRIRLRRSTLFQDGNQIHQVRDDQEQWVRLDDTGYPETNGVVLTIDNLDPDEEYDCVRNAIDLGLAQLGVSDSVSSHDLKQSFCYNECEVVGEIQAK
ncbi:MAG: hypothetical protein U0941_08740 [Planctomycetaceae bacterium]